MKRTFGKQAQRAGLALAAVGAFAVLGINITSAAPPPSAPTFASAKFSIEAGNGAAETAATAGGLTCTFRETGLQSFQLITYACDADVVGALEGCVYRNKLVGGSATQLSIIKDPLALLGGPIGFVSNNKGQINAMTTTAVPVSGGGHEGELCTEPAEAQVIAVRWCNASLTDSVNNLVGATAVELFEESYAGAGTSVPPCSALLASP
jgi:hypothetical protein